MCRNLLNWYMKIVEDLCPEFIGANLSVAIMDDEGIQEVNRAYLDHDYVTDVISFAYPPMPPDDFWTAEVIVNAPLAAKLGAENGNTNHEFALYLVHGCHHLTGAEDDTELKKENMIREELDWLKEADALGLLDHLLITEPSTGA